MMLKQNKDKVAHADKKRLKTSKDVFIPKENVIEPIEDQSINAGLNEVVTDYWRDKPAPHYRGYKDSPIILHSSEQKESTATAADIAVGSASATVESADITAGSAHAVKESVNTTVESEDGAKITDNSAETAHKQVKSDVVLGGESAIIKDKNLGSDQAEYIQLESVQPEGVQPEDPQPEDSQIKETQTEDVKTEQELKSKPKQKKEKKAKKPKTKKKITPLRVLGGVGIFVMVFLITVAATFFIMQHNGKNKMMASDVSDEEITGPKDATLENGGKKVVYKGHTYQYNENISTILCMGVDREEYNEDSTYGEGGQADAIFLVVLDNATGETKMLPISRNTMVEIDEYKEDGTYWRQNEIQITLAYTYGDGKEKSCENVSKAVSRLLYGMPINNYATINLSAIGTLNDAVGGVNLNVIEDLSTADPELVAGANVTLKGQQAETYVRSRKTEGTDLEVDNNVARMERQQQYMAAFMKQLLSQTRQTPTLPVSMFNMVKGDMVTNITPSEVTYMASLMVQKGLNNSIVSIPGKAKKGEYTEVYVDNKALYEIILDAFYDQVQ